MEILPAVWADTSAPAVLKTRTGKVIKYIRRDEVHRMLSVLEGRDKLLIEMLWNTGARVSELLSLTPGSVNFAEGTVTVRTLKKKRTLPRKAKEIKIEIRGIELALKQDPGSKILRKKLEDARMRLDGWERQAPAPAYRSIPISPELSGKIAAYVMAANMSRDDLLFPITRVRVHQIVQDAGGKTGLEKGRSHPHAFRHGFGITAVLGGVPPLVLRTWMGHSNIESTLIYTEVLAQDTKSYLQNMSF